MYQFVSNFNENKPVVYSFFYQICIYPNSITKKYQLRKFVLNPDMEIVQINDYDLTKNQVRQFYKIKKEHEYKQYPTTNLNNIMPPHMGDLVASNSNMLNDVQSGPVAYQSNAYFSEI